MVILTLKLIYSVGSIIENKQSILASLIQAMSLFAAKESSCLTNNVECPLNAIIVWFQSDVFHCIDNK